MLKKELRIRKQKDFDRVFSQGSFFSEGFLAVKIVKNSYGYSRFAFIVSNKVSKKSYRRNRIRRILRESIRSRLVLIIEGFDLVIMVRSDIADKDIEIVDKAVDRLLKKARLLKE